MLITLGLGWWGWVDPWGLLVSQPALTSHSQEPVRETLCQKIKPRNSSREPPRLTRSHKHNRLLNQDNCLLQLLSRWSRIITADPVDYWHCVLVGNRTGGSLDLHPSFRPLLPAIYICSCGAGCIGEVLDIQAEERGGRGVPPLWLWVKIFQCFGLAVLLSVSLRNSLVPSHELWWNYTLFYP